MAPKTPCLSNEPDTRNPDIGNSTPKTNSCQPHPAAPLPPPDLRQIWLISNESERAAQFESVGWVSGVLGVSNSRVYGLADEGKIERLKVAGRLYFLKSDILRLVGQADREGR
jgi:hypothetical protein